MTLSAPKKGDRFFRAMVLMGGSMALGCGGATARDDASTSAGGGSGGSGGGGGSGPGPGGTGGTGAIDIPLDPSSTTGMVRSPVDPGPFPCVPAQFDCGVTPPECTYPDSWRVPEDCRCDETRPKSAADCATDQVFVCRRGTERADGTPYTEMVPFECACVRTGEYCSAECSLAYAPLPYHCERLPAAGGAAGAAAYDTLCGCAIIVLK